MSDSDDDDICVVNEVLADSEKVNKNWKWKIPNPKVPKGSIPEILKKVRKKLQMDVPLKLSEKEATSRSASGEPNDSKTCPSDIQHTQQTTPQKPSSVEPHSSLTPEQILELTDHCLDSDNEPDMTPIESPSQSHDQNRGPKRALNFGFTVSSKIRYQASRFFGAGTSSDDVDKIFSQGDQMRSPSKSPSLKKRRLSKNSPIRHLPSHRNLGKSPLKRTPTKQSPSKTGDSPLKVGKGDGMDETLPEGPYYLKAFCFIIHKVYNNVEYRHLFLPSELDKMKQIDNSKEEFQLYVRLLNRKDKWNRASDIVYNDIAEDLSPFFDILEEEDFISCDMSEEKLDVLLNMLKVDELKNLCSVYKIKKTGTKTDLIDAFLLMHRTQPTFGGASPLRKSIKEVLGRCVKLTPKWRLVFRRSVLLFSMFHSYEDLDAISSAQALLLLQVKLGHMTFPLCQTQLTPTAQVFAKRDQLIRFEEAKELCQELNAAMETKNSQLVEELTQKSVKQFGTLLELEDETNHVLSLPKFLQRFCAGSIYVYSLTKSVDGLKQGKNFNFALNVLELLTGQKVYCQHYRGRWAHMQASLLQINLKDVGKACQVLCCVLSDQASLSSVDKMLLQQRALQVLKVKKNGLSKSDKDRLERLMDCPCQNPEEVEIPARAFLSSKPGLKKVYIRDTVDGKEFMSVEETVLAHYRSKGFQYGLHDEGSTLSSLCLLSLWDHIYDTSIPFVFQSPYQDKPLDWGSKTFYETRKEALDAYFHSLESQDVLTVAEKLSNLRSKHSGITSVVNWDRLEKLDINTLLDCLSISVLVAVSRRLVMDWKSNRSGFPDLMMWNPSQRECIFIEVKSPNDTLSTVQCLWLDFLRNCNVKAIVAHIRESGSKGIEMRQCFPVP